MKYFLLPHDGVLAGFVFCFPLHTNELNPAGGEGGGDPHLGWVGGCTVIMNNQFR